MQDMILEKDIFSMLVDSVNNKNVENIWYLDK